MTKMPKDECVRISANRTTLSINKVKKFKRLYFQFTIVSEKYFTWEQNQRTGIIQILIYKITSVIM